MNITKFLMMCLVLIFLAGATAEVSFAQDQKQDKKIEKRDDDDDDDKNDSPEMQKKLAKEAKISMEEARRKALERVPGEIIEGELEKKKGRLIYDFDIRRSSDKKIWEVLIDAKTGEIISAGEDEEQDDDEDTSSNLPPVKSKHKWYEFWRKIPGLSKL